MDGTQIGWLAVFVVLLLVILFCYAYLKNEFRRLIIPASVLLPQYRRTAHRHE